MARKRTHEEFIKELRLIQPTIEVIGLYKDVNSKILIRYEGFDFLSVPYSLLNGALPSIRTVKDKTNFTISKFREIHGDKYGYAKVEYVNAISKVEIECSLHGSFYQTPHGHLNGYGCMDCSNIIIGLKGRLSIEDFVRRSNVIHNNKYDYSLVNYKSVYDKVKIICPIHQEFKQSVSAHVNAGSGCPKCSALSGSLKNRASRDHIIDQFHKTHGDKYDYSKFEYITKKIKSEIICPIHDSFLQNADNHSQGKGCPVCKTEKMGWSYSKWEKQGLSSHYFDSFKVYIIRCYNSNEEFYKIGKTFVTIKKRFCRTLFMPYDYEVIKVIESKIDARYISELERKLQNVFIINKYKPEISFGGQTECFSEIDLPVIEAIANNNGQLIMDL